MTNDHILAFLVGVAFIVIAVLAGCAATAERPEGLPAKLDAVVRNHPGALVDAPPEARRLVDDLRCTWSAWESDALARQRGCLPTTPTN